MSYELMHIHNSLPTKQRVRDKSRDAIDLVGRRTRIFAAAPGLSLVTWEMSCTL